MIGMFRKVRIIAALVAALACAAGGAAAQQPPAGAVQIGQGAAQPSWLAITGCALTSGGAFSCPFSAITGTPTTLAGYGITNARTIVINPNYYVNGNSSATAACGPAGASTCSAGTDSNNCLTPGAACLTAQHALDLILGNASVFGIDFGGSSGNIYLAHNTGTANYAVSCARGPLIGTSVINIVGDSAAPTATVMTAAAAQATASVKDGCTLDFQYVVFADNATNNVTQSLSVGGTGNAGHVDISTAQFNSLAIGTQIAAGNMGSITATGLITIAGGAPTAMASSDGGLIDTSGQTVTVVNATVTITIASPAVVTWTAHGLTAGAPVAFATTGALPTGLTASTIYYITNDASLTANTFHVSDTSAHALAGTNTINTSGTQSGTQTGMPGFSTAFAYMPNGGIIKANNATFSGSAAGTRCQVNGPLNLGAFNPNAVFPGTTDCVPISYQGQIKVPTGSGGSSSYTAGALGAPLVSGGSGGANAFGLNTASNNLSGDVALNNTANYFDGPSMAQGSIGTWFASGSVELTTSTTDVIVCKLWDGTTVISSSLSNPVAGSGNVSVALSGFITAPAGNIRISCKDSSSTNGAIKHNFSGSNADSTIWGFQIK